mgnify:CR=1 FL=1
MKKTRLLLLLGVAAFGAWWYFERGPGATAPEGVYAASASNTADFQQLVEASKEARKPLVMLFTGSEWCPPCQKMARDIFATEKWRTFVDEGMHFVVYDFPRGGGASDAEAERRRAMAERFNIEGFPTLITIDPEDGEMRRRVGFHGGEASEYIDWIRG